MDFLIKENATLPILKMKVVENNEMNVQELKKRMENVAITFSMIDSLTGRYVISNKSGGVYINNDSINEEIIVYYEWDKRDTKKAGLYLGEFIIDFFDENGNENGKLLFPIREKLFIHIQESFGKTSINGID